MRAKFLEQIDKVVSLSHESKGHLQMTCTLCPDCGQHYRVMIFPAVRQFFGGKDDGRMVFPRFILDVAAMEKLFNTPVNTHFDNTQEGAAPYLCLRGRIGEVWVEIRVLAFPPDNVQPSERQYKVGPRKGQVEPMEPTD